MCQSLRTRQRAFGLLEYTALIIIILAGLLAFGPYIQHAMQGQYRKVGEGFGFLRQYNAAASVDCAYDDQNKVWYSQACYNNEMLKARCNYKPQQCIPCTKPLCDAIAVQECRQVIEDYKTKWDEDGEKGDKKRAARKRAEYARCVDFILPCDNIIECNTRYGQCLETGTYSQCVAGVQQSCKTGCSSK